MNQEMVVDVLCMPPLLTVLVGCKSKTIEEPFSSDVNSQSASIPGVIHRYPHGCHSSCSNVAQPRTLISFPSSSFVISDWAGELWRTCDRI